MTGLLIVNGDDLGGHTAATDAILAQYADGRISSASALVWMEDSGRAAELARAAGLPVGLHLNLTQPYSEPGVPADARRRQADLLGRFARGRRGRWLPLRPRSAALSAVVADQLERFELLYGRQPTHIDGHHHVHVAPAVLRSPAVRDVGRIRGGRRPDRRVLRDAPQRAKLALVARGLRSPDVFLPLDALRAIAADGGAEALRAALAPALTAAVEVMAHPGNGVDDRFLSSEQWREALTGLRLGSFRELGDAAGATLPATAGRLRSAPAPRRPPR